MSGAERYCVPIIEAQALYGVRWTAGDGNKSSRVFNDDLGGNEHLTYWGNRVEFQSRAGSWHRYSYNCIYNPVSEGVLNVGV